MKVVSKYIAEDGKVFDNKKECQIYEKTLKFGKIKNVKFFNWAGNLLNNIENEFFSIYTNFYKVIIPTKEDFIALKEILRKENCELNEITSEGTWYRITDMYEENYQIISEERYKEIIKDMQHLLMAK